MGRALIIATASVVVFATTAIVGIVRFAVAADRAPVPIFRVDTVTFDVTGPLTICVDTTARTPGYTNLRLEPTSGVPTTEGIYEFKVVGEAPTGVVAQVLTPLALRHVWPNSPSDARAVRIVAETNTLAVEIDDRVTTCPSELGGDEPSPAMDSLIGGTWLAEDIRGGGVIDNVQSTVSFTEDGRLAGSGGCNRLKGSFRVTGDAMQISPLATTRMMCPAAVMDQERKFLAALEAVGSSRIDGPYLRLLSEDGIELVRLTRQ